MKNNQIQIDLETLEKIVSEVKLQVAQDSSLSRTVILERLKETDSHTGEDEIKIYQVSSYSECNSKLIYTNEVKCQKQYLHFEKYRISITWFESDKKAVVEYYNIQTGGQIQDWNEIAPEHQVIITAIIDSFCSLKGLTKWIY